MFEIMADLKVGGVMQEVSHSHNVGHAPELWFYDAF